LSYLANEWQRKGATLSDKTARKEFGLTQDEIDEALRAGRLDYRVGSVFGNPWLRLLRREVEDLVKAKSADRDFTQRRAKAELAQVNRELKAVRAHLAALEEHRSNLLAELAR
jgi:endonuclease/exonuclease/phosphatase family metal-dependent hydrolase